MPNLSLFIDIFEKILQMYLYDQLSKVLFTIQKLPYACRSQASMNRCHITWLARLDRRSRQDIG